MRISPFGFGAGALYFSLLLFASGLLPIHLFPLTWEIEPGERSGFARPEVSLT